MLRRFLCLTTILLTLLSVSACGEKKADNAKLALGTWDVTKTHDGGPPKGGVVEFTKDGKIKVSGEQEGKKQVFEGTYKIEGNKLTWHLGTWEPGAEQVFKIKVRLDRDLSLPPDTRATFTIFQSLQTDVVITRPRLTLAIPGGLALDDFALAALGILIVSFSSGIVTARSFGLKYHYDVDANLELVGFGAANVASSSSAAFPSRPRIPAPR